MNKIIKVLCFITVIILVIVIIIFGSIFYSHKEIIENGENISEFYSNYSIKKESFVLNTHVIAIEDINYIYFTIYDSKSNLIVFDSQENNLSWRTFDFKEIYFSYDSLDVIVESGDMGSLIFHYNGNYTWSIE